MRDVPAPVRAQAIEAGALAWLDGLPGLVGDMARKWDLTVGAAFADATEAYVAPAARGDGTAVVLKLYVPRPGGHAAHEIAVLRSAGGRGCARLIASDEVRGALLTERLGPAMAGLGLPQPRRLEILTDLAAAVWDSTPLAAPGLPTGAEKAARLAGDIPRRWARLGRPCTARAVEQAVAAARRRRAAHDPARAVLVHGDVHQWNALRGGDGFRLVDPDGLWAEPECDLGVLMREDPDELLTGDPRDRARWLAARTGTDPVAVWDWGLADRVATGLALTAVGLQPVAGRMLAAADRVSAR